MPSRLLREAILDSEAVNALSVPAELFYRRLMSVVDDFGRFDARPSVLRSRCYPLRVASVREADISRWLAECETAGLIALYSSDGRQYLLFRKLGEPRAKTSKFPAPPAGLENICAHMRADENICKQTRAYVPDSDSDSDSDSKEEPPNPPFASEGFASAWAEWVQHRKEKGQKLTSLAVRKQFAKLSRIGEARAIAAIEHSIANGYQGIYEPDPARGARASPQTAAADKLVEALNRPRGTQHERITGPDAADKRLDS